MSYDNNNRFGLWLNTDRQEETHPHLTGSGETGNKPHWVSAWFSKDIDDEDKQALAAILKKYSAKSNKPFLNISIKLKESKGGGQARGDEPAGSGASPQPDYDDDLPF